MNAEITSVTVAAALRERISRGDLRPGTRLPTQQDLSAEFGVNRTVVRHALGTLKADGLISMGRGAPATVAVPAPSSPVSAGSPQPAAVLLTARLQAAFRAEHITVDCFSLTTETLNNALMQALHGINTQEFAPRSITVRVLLPSNGAHLALPRLVSDPGDDRPLDRLRGITHTWTDALRASVESLRVRHAVPDVTLDIRSVAVTPLHKLYLLNRTESLILRRIPEKQAGVSIGASSLSHCARVTHRITQIRYEDADFNTPRPTRIMRELLHGRLQLPGQRLRSEPHEVNFHMLRLKCGTHSRSQLVDVLHNGHPSDFTRRVGSRNRIKENEGDKSCE